LTRAQFESLWHTFNRQPGAGPVVEQPASIRRSMANAYGSMSILSNEARKRGLDRTPEFQLQMKVLRMQLLAKALQDKIKQQYSEPTTADLTKYYNDNKASFEELSLHRLQIPKRGPQTPAVEGKPAAEPVSISPADAEGFRKRALAGEDFDKLQKEVIEKLQLKTPPPVTSGKRRHGEFPPQEEAEIFALSPGSVTRVLDEGSSYVIYKIDNKRTLSLDEVRGNIARTVAEQNIRDAESKVENSAEKKLDPVYFSDAPAKEAPMPPPAAENPAPAPPPAAKP
jgi:parvulin-like peptidyl-prolyl isomerase